MNVPNSLVNLISDDFVHSPKSTPHNVTISEKDSNSLASSVLERFFSRLRPRRSVKIPL